MEVVASLYLKNQTGNLSQNLYTSRSDENVLVFVSWVTHATAGQSFLVNIKSQIPNTSPINADFNMGQNLTSSEIWNAFPGLLLQSSAGNNVTLDLTVTGIANYDFTVVIIKV